MNKWCHWIYSNFPFTACELLHIYTDTRTLWVRYEYCLSVELNSLFSVSCFLFQAHNIKQYNLLKMLTLSDICLLFKNKINHEGDNELTPKSRYEELYLKKFSFRIDFIAFLFLFRSPATICTLILYSVRLLQVARLFHIKFYHSYA